MKSKDLTFSIIYGDLRQKLLAELLADDGYKIKTFGYDNKSEYKNIIVCDSYKYAIENSDIVIGPIPFSKDNKNLFTVYNNLPTLSIEDFFKACSQNILIAGVVSDFVKQIAKDYNISILDLYEIEEIAILNSVPTSEGAIQIAMNESDITLHGSNVLILGYGRCGKTLAKMLNGIGSNVYVCARKSKDICYIETNGFSPLKYSDLNKNLQMFDFIFNTVPSMIIDESLINNLKKSCVIIDLASAPGGTDFESASKYNIKALFCPSLPGRIAPKTAANIIKKAILNILESGEYKYGQIEKS